MWTSKSYAQRFGWYVGWLFTVSCTHIWVHEQVKLAALQTTAVESFPPNILWIARPVASPQWWRLQTFLSGEASDSEGGAKDVRRSAQSLPHTQLILRAHTYLHQNPALSLLLRCSSIISSSKCLTRQLASRQMAFQMRWAPFVYFSVFGGVWKSFADSAAHLDAMAGFCSCRVSGKLNTFVISKQLKFYCKWFRLCRQSSEKTQLGFERWRPLWGQILLNAVSLSRNSLNNRQSKEEKSFWNHFTPAVLWTLLLSN